MFPSKPIVLEIVIVPDATFVDPFRYSSRPVWIFPAHLVDIHHSDPAIREIGRHCFSLHVVYARLSKAV
jgi:hypothetical protein